VEVPHTSTRAGLSSLFTEFVVGGMTQDKKFHKPIALFLLFCCVSLSLANNPIGGLDKQ
jgi:hypothetical protein